MNGKMGLIFPVNCPFCDEKAMPKKGKHRIVDFDAIYTLRECTMGHTFYSVEYVPNDQDEIVVYLKKRKQILDREYKRNYMRNYRSVMGEREREYD